MNRFCFLVSIFALTTCAQADVFSYSQNNPPLQHCIQDKADTSCFLVNGDFVLSKITATPTNAFYRKTASINGFSHRTYDFHDKEKVGFRVGVGAGIHNRFNFSLQYTHFRGGNHHTFEFSEPAAADINNFKDLQNLHQFQNPGVDYTIEPYSKQKLRLQMADLLLQTAHWMNTKLRFQPFGGIRYQYFRRQLVTHTYLFEKIGPSQKKNLQNLFSKVTFRIQQLGVLAGTDVRYVFTRRFFLFSNLTVGLFSGTHKRKYLARWQEFDTTISYQDDIEKLDIRIRELHNDKMANGNDEKKLKDIEKKLEVEERALNKLKEDKVKNERLLFRNENVLTHFQPLVQLQFGLGFNDVINDWFLISFRIAYEVSSQFDPNARAINPQPMGTPDPLRFNDSIQTSALIIGFTFGF
ncbi:MAG: hypothetical protein K940chlam8_01023 [Chlamydiae bacterium]|nr:hypothetical protein [Chlamydiota bacterium]